MNHVLQPEFSISRRLSRFFYLLFIPSYQPCCDESYRSITRSVALPVDQVFTKVTSHIFVRSTGVQDVNKKIYLICSVSQWNLKEKPALKLFFPQDLLLKTSLMDTVSSNSVIKPKTPRDEHFLSSSTIHLPPNAGAFQYIIL